MLSRPASNEYDSFFSGYVALVIESNVIEVLENQPTELEKIAALVPAQREQFRYAANKWSIREVFGHIIDCERVFGYRAFCISRGDMAPFPGFDESVYVGNSRYNDTRLADLVRSFETVRLGNLTFLKSLVDSDWKRKGTANNCPISVRGLAFIMAGHPRHHFKILRERYGVA